MPRLTHDNYQNLYHQLHWLWHNDQQCFGLLSSTEQYYLHDYFQLSRVMSQDELSRHRQAVTKLCPSLPQRAGRAAAKLQRSIPIRHSVNEARVGNARNADHRVVVTSVINPDLSMDRLAQILMLYSKYRDESKNYES